MTATVTAPVKLTRKDAAEYIGVSVPTLASWATLGKGPRFLKAGARVWYLQSELDHWIESRLTNCSSAVDA